MAPKQRSKAVKSRVPDVSSAHSSIKDSSFELLKDKIQARLQTTNKSATQRKDSDDRKLKDKAAKSEQRGKKRDSSGALVQRDANSKVGAYTPRDHDAGTNESDVLLRELKELGGTAEDLELMDDIASDSEVEGVENPISMSSDSNDKKGLAQGMANILKEIALVNGSSIDNTTSSEEEDDDSAGGSDDSSPKPVWNEKSSRKRLSDTRLKCEPQADWFNSTKSAQSSESEVLTRPPQHVLDALHSHGQALLDAENDMFKSIQQSSASQSFYNTVIASGTLSDKISALTLAVQESPLHNVKALQTLVNLASKRSRAQAVDVLRALKDLFAQGSLLPADRKLYSFVTQPALLRALAKVKRWQLGDPLPRHVRESDLVCWTFENWLKEQYFEILKILEIWSNDEIEFAKSRAVGYVYELLKEKPEQEANLLRLLINKLGDPVKKIASQTSYLLMQLLVTHPAMKLVVISAIETDFIFRPGQSLHGKYYATVTINQTVLTMQEEPVAEKLLDIYFGLFTGLLKANVASSLEDSSKSVSVTRGQRQRRQRKGSQSNNPQVDELHEKLTSAVLTGVNRAYPYAGSDHRNFDQHLETLFRVTHSANFNTSIQAMMLIQKLTTTHQASADRFYRSLYESLLDPRLITASKQQLFLNLLHRSLKADSNMKRVKAFVKRLVQISSLHEPPFISGVLFLIQDLEKSLPSLRTLADQPEELEDESENFRDVVENSENENSSAIGEDVTDEQPNSARDDDRSQLRRYDGHKRAPEHSNADNSCIWEALPFLAHYHPSVSVMIDHYLEQSKLPGRPDLTLHTLIHFLDRFVYRNPKLASNKMRGSSIMQPMLHDDVHAVLINSTARQAEPAVNTDEFKHKKDQDVAAEDVFFHRYFNTLGKDKDTKRAKKLHSQADGDDENEDAIWRAMVDSAPDLEGGASSDEDMDLSDFEDEMAGDDDGLADHDFIAGGDNDDDDDSGVDIEAGILDDLDPGSSDTEEAVRDIERLPSDGNSEDQIDNSTKIQDRQRKKERRKQQKNLPTFASAADYVKMLEDDDNEDRG